MLAVETQNSVVTLLAANISYANMLTVYIYDDMKEVLIFDTSNSATFLRWNRRDVASLHCTKVL